MLFYKKLSSFLFYETLKFIPNLHHVLFRTSGQLTGYFWKSRDEKEKKCRPLAFKHFLFIHTLRGPRKIKSIPVYFCAVYLENIMLPLVLLVPLLYLLHLLPECP